MQVQKKASLHEKAVQKVARGEVDDDLSKRRRRRATGTPQVIGSHYVVVHPAIKETEVWQQSHQSQREIISETEVLIHNLGVPWLSKAGA